MKRAVFLDKDGTLIDDVPYNVDPSLIKWQEGAIESLKKLQENNYHLILISNQSGVAHGFFEQKKLDVVTLQLQTDLMKANVKLDGVFYCPHHPAGTVEEYSTTCNCRKPAPGMILKAAEQFEIDLNQSWMVGDILNDVEAGNRAGCKTILINNGNETEWIVNSARRPYAFAATMKHAAKIILETRHYG